MCAKLLPSYLTLCDPMDCSPPGLSVHGILQARMLEWVSMPFSRESFWPRDQTGTSDVSCIGRQILYHCSVTWGALVQINLNIWLLKVKLVAQWCLTLCDPVDCSLPGSYVHGIFQARTPEWAAISFSRGSSLPKGLNPGLQHCRQTLYPLNHQGSQSSFNFLLLKYKLSEKSDRDWGLKLEKILHDLWLPWWFWFRWIIERKSRSSFGGENVEIFIKCFHDSLNFWQLFHWDTGSMSMPLVSGWGCDCWNQEYVWRLLRPDHKRPWVFWLICWDNGQQYEKSDYGKPMCGCAQPIISPDTGFPAIHFKVPHMYVKKPCRKWIPSLSPLSLPQLRPKY